LAVGGLLGTRLSLFNKFDPLLFTRLFRIFYTDWISRKKNGKTDWRHQTEWRHDAA